MARGLRVWEVVVTDGKVKVPITFYFFEGDEVAHTETLSEDVIKIGRLESSHLRIEDEDVSRMHAVIEVGGPDEVYIIDLGSTSGTILPKSLKVRLNLSF